MLPSPSSPLPALPHAPAFGAIDWHQPWLRPWRAQGEPAAQRAQAGSTLAALQPCDASPVRFVAQNELPAGIAYERYIFETGQCPVREGLHDFFNGLCWQHFPRSKARLNTLQAQAIGAQGGLQQPRGPLRDAITVFDENGAVLAAPPDVLAPLWTALRAHDWRRALVDLRPLWDQVQFVLFGHALLEKLVAPRVGITAHVLALPIAATGVPPPQLSLATLDAQLAPWLQADRLAAKPFTPLPVLGVPGWHAANAAVSFYDDASVFRPARAPKTTSLQPRQIAQRTPAA
ncbi:MAG: hypothetical protein GAK30_00723 [Paracidovorax wautersii]|uniref:DUF3025 domain-containing protein n=1 Tax=Paracidovorax wautersii TaxID=1177982 RepID=A0A7V8FR47_9BURK|nr:MAG: hypothetical protein GAK30_00723 [Paracidovorax wautersii]